MPDDDHSPPDEAEERKRRLRRAAQRTDSNPRTVAVARLLRSLLPGDERYGDPLSTAGEQLPQRLGRAVSDVRRERPSAVRELGLGALQAWQALSEAQGRGRGEVDVAILFTDLVGFSDWALEAGDEATLELLRRIGTVEEQTIVGGGGRVVKRLGDGLMAVFENPGLAVRAVHAEQEELDGIEVAGYRPELRAGVHCGRPRRIGDDYLGVDVNVAARVADAAGGGEVLVSEAAREKLDEGELSFGRSKRLRASGTPKGLVVCAARPAG